MVPRQSVLGRRPRELGSCLLVSTRTRRQRSMSQPSAQIDRVGLETLLAIHTRDKYLLDSSAVCEAFDRSLMFKPLSLRLMVDSPQLSLHASTAVEIALACRFSQKLFPTTSHLYFPIVPVVNIQSSNMFQSYIGSSWPPIQR